VNAEIVDRVWLTFKNCKIIIRADIRASFSQCRGTVCCLLHCNTIDCVFTVHLSLLHTDEKTICKSVRSKQQINIHMPKRQKVTRNRSLKCAINRRKRRQKSKGFSGVTWTHNASTSCQPYTSCTGCQSINFKISTIVYRSLAGTAPVYLADECKSTNISQIRLKPPDIYKLLNNAQEKPHNLLKVLAEDLEVNQEWQTGRRVMRNSWSCNHRTVMHRNCTMTRSICHRMPSV